MTRPLLGFSLETFARRRALACAALDGGALVLPAAPILKRSRDTEHRYRPDSELFYLTGCVDPGAVAVLRDSEEEGFALFLPEQDAKGEMWVGPRTGPEEGKDRFGADVTFPLGELEDRLPALLNSRERVFFRMGVHPRVESLVIGALRWARGRGSRTGEGPRAVEDPGVILDDLRMLKDPDEISRIREATALTVAAFREALAAARPGMGEWEVEAIVESAFRRGGALGPAFPTIVGSGRNGCILHYIQNRDVIEDGQLVVLDAGAEVDLYSGDMTRTFPSGGRFTDRQLEVYDVVLRAHTAAISEIKPGAEVGRIHDAALEELTRGLIGLGLLEGELEALLEEKAYEPFFPHQTSHWLGLDVHDVGDYASRAGSRVLQPGMVLTVEPGLYLPVPPEGPPHPYAGMGVRIEDDLLVTEEGVENLTGNLPVGPGELEILMRTGDQGLIQ